MYSDEKNIYIHACISTFTYHIHLCVCVWYANVCLHVWTCVGTHIQKLKFEVGCLFQSLPTLSVGAKSLLNPEYL